MSQKTRKIVKVANSKGRMLYPCKDKEQTLFLSSGSTITNLALSGKSDGGFARGRICNIVGDTTAGKSEMALEVAADAIYNKKLDVIFNKAGEGEVDLPIDLMFGRKLRKKIDWRRSSTVEKLGRDVGREFKKRNNLLYIVDSLDSLSTDKSMKRFQDAAESDKEEKGAYGAAEKASYLSQSFFDNIAELIAGKDITLLLISQIRVKVGLVFGKPYYRAGGKALDHICHQVLWLYTAGKVKGTKKKVKRVYAQGVKAVVEKNKISKPYRDANYRILFDYGIDDINSMINFLWSEKKNSFKVKGLKKALSREKYIEWIEENDKERMLQKKCQRKWHEIEEAFKPRRKSKWG